MREKSQASIYFANYIIRTRYEMPGSLHHSEKSVFRGLSGDGSRLLSSARSGPLHLNACKSSATQHGTRNVVRNMGRIWHRVVNT